MKRIFLWGLLIIFFLLTFPVWAEEIGEEVFLGERIDVACFNIWLHADGKTWQNTDGLPGPEEPYEGEDLEHEPQREQYLRYLTFQAKPNQEWAKKYEQIRAEADLAWFTSLTAEEYIAVGGAGKASKDGGEYIPLNYRLFFLEVWECQPFGYRLAPEVSPQTVGFYLHDKRQAEDVKRDDQLELVEGWRWYLPIHLKFYGVPKPILVDLEAVSVQQTCPVLTQSKQLATAIFRNNGDREEQFTACYFAGGEKVASEVLSLAAGESCQRNFNWQAPAKAGNCPLRIEVLPLVGEANLDNNQQTVTIKVVNPNFITPECSFVHIDENEWEETYTWTERYDCSYTDEDGVYHSQSCSYTERKTILYQEWLSVDFQIDTKQGDPQGGRESRGYWEIYSDSQNRNPQYNTARGINIYGIDPNKVTRSGYGYDLSVVTTYWTDWETKVPSRARAKGGAFSGPTQVVVQFHDSQTVQELVPVKTENVGQKEITTWRLPVTSHTFPNGEMVEERKYYTDLNLSDGQYVARVIVSSCGRGIGAICQDEMVYIYGSVYDDIYTRPAKESEW